MEQALRPSCLLKLQLIVDYAASTTQATYSCTRMSMQSLHTTYMHLYIIYMNSCFTTFSKWVLLCHQAGQSPGPSPPFSYIAVRKKLEQSVQLLQQDC